MKTLRKIISLACLTAAFGSVALAQVYTQFYGIRVRDGTAALPPISFTSETSKGLYSGGTGLLGISGILSWTSTAAASAPTATLIASAGNVNNGTHDYCVTFINAFGQTSAGTTSNVVTTDAGHGQVSLTAIPLGPTGTTSRKIYREKAGEAGTATWFLLTTISDNTTTTYTDNATDASLGTVATRLNDNY